MYCFFPVREPVTLHADTKTRLNEKISQRSVAGGVLVLADHNPGYHPDDLLREKRNKTYGQT
jgi:hypothetical protein